MKIALAHKRLDLAGGTERDFLRTAEGLRDLGHEVHLFCAEFRVPAPQGITAHRIPVLPLGRTARLLSFAFLAPKLIARHRCDLVMSFGRMAKQDVVRSGGGSHRLFLEKMAQGQGSLRRFWHGVSLYHRSVLAVERLQYLSRNYKKIFAVSGEVKRDLIASYQVPDDKIAVLYNGVDHDRFHPRNREATSARIRKQWGIPIEAPVVLFVGNGFRRKGLNRLLRLWEAPGLESYLLVVGEDQKQSRYASIAAKRANGKVVLAGRQERVRDYYAAADLLALPAYQEAFGNVVLEALASGLPVIVSRTVGAAEVLSGELQGGVLVDPDDPSELRAKIHRFLEPVRWGRLSAQARVLGESYSWKNHFRKLEEHLLEIAETGGRGACREPRGRTDAI